MELPSGYERWTSSVECTSVVDVLTDERLDPFFVGPPRAGVGSAWYGHVPFAFWLMRALRPRLFVELGTHSGVSYAAFCEAVLIGGLETRCFAVDTWRGDEHAGFYDNDVYEGLRAFHDERYSAFSRLFRTTFDEAAETFDDGSIDLLHVDGCHRFDAVTHDFETWLPRLSRRAVVVFHDTNVREKDFGVWRLWSDLKTRYPNFEFLHEHGLGLLAVGSDAARPVQALCELREPVSIARVRGRFADAGRHCALRSELARVRAELAMAGEAREAAETATVRALEARLEQARVSLEVTRRALEGVEAAHQGDADDLARARTEAREAANEASRLLTIGIWSETQASRVRASLDDTRRELGAARRDLADADARLQQNEATIATLQQRLSGQAHLGDQVDHLEQTIRVITQSTMWRILAPLRAVARPLPGGVRAAMRGGLRVVWCVLTPWRIPIRREIRGKLLAISQGQVAPAPDLAPAPVERPSDLPSPAALDRFALSVIPPLQGDRRAMISWYDAERPDVSVVVVNWNRGDMTLLCLQHLWENTSGWRYEIVVVDNGSEPADLERLRAQASPARIIALGANKFFGEANNIGVEAARGRYVCLLNNDAFVSSDWLAPIVEVLEANGEAGAVGPCFRYPDGSLQEAGAEINPDGSVLQLGKGGRGDDKLFHTLRTADYVSGACLTLRRDDFLRVLGFDFTWDPAYYEDVDLCLKLRLIGLRTFYCPRSMVVHIEHATTADGGATLGFGNVMLVNRQKFVARWGRYLQTSGREEPALVPGRDQWPGSRIIEASATGACRRVLIYTPFNLTPGGGERYILTIANALRDLAQVALVTPYPLSRIRLLTLGRDFGLDLDHLELVRLGDVYERPLADLALVLGNEVLPSVGRLARRNVFICQFPFPIEHEEFVRRSRPFWKEFDLVLTYSEFVRSHVQRQIGAFDLLPRPVEVLSPPVPLMPAREKRPTRILHVGRFFIGAHCKQQGPMIEALRMLVEAGVEAELHFAGSTMPDPKHQAYYAGLLERARGLPVFFHADCSGNGLRELYGESAIYWHATGVGRDVEAEPHLAEHFGITVLEAMSARCIPIVFAAGGPASVVEDGVTGFHFRTLEELASRTRQIIEGMPQAGLNAMADAAERAARTYDEPTFEARVRELSLRLMGA